MVFLLPVCKGTWVAHALVRSTLKVKICQSKFSSFQTILIASLFPQQKTRVGSNFQLDCNPSQVKAKSNLRLVASLLLHSQWFSFFSFFSSINFNWPTSNAYISVNSQPIWVKLWILHLMTNLSKVYDTTPNLNNSKSQLISTTSNA